MRRSRRAYKEVEMLCQAQVLVMLRRESRDDGAASTGKRESLLSQEAVGMLEVSRMEHVGWRSWPLV